MIQAREIGNIKQCTEKRGGGRQGVGEGREGRGLGLNHLLPYGMKAELRTCLVLWK